MLLGLDFDNTLIGYDKLFHHVAVAQDLVPERIAVNKIAVRDYLREQNREDDWTRLQGAVYGRYILQADAFPGMQRTLQQIVNKQIPICIVSHKTRRPYIGESWDLHSAARSWLTQERFYDAAGLGLSEESVFFEPTKEEKVARILALGCTHYVDDLPEILDMIPDHVEKILFAPNGASEPDPSWKLMRSWQELIALLDI